MKKNIPNFLTTYRLIVSIFIPILFYYNKYNLLGILFTIALFSDAVDGILARKWKVTSNYGKIADAIGDKLLALSACTTFIIVVDKNFLIILLLEIIIALVNFSKYISNHNFKNKNFDNQNSSIYGKIKTWFLFISLFIGFLCYKFSKFKILLIPLIRITAILQIITIINYAIKKND